MPNLKTCPRNSMKRIFICLTSNRVSYLTSNSTGTRYFWTPQTQAKSKTPHQTQATSRIQVSSIHSQFSASQLDLTTKRKQRNWNSQYRKITSSICRIKSSATASFTQGTIIASLILLRESQSLAFKEVPNLQLIKTSQPKLETWLLIKSYLQQPNRTIIRMP